MPHPPGLSIEDVFDIIKTMSCKKQPRHALPSTLRVPPMPGGPAADSQRFMKNHGQIRHRVGDVIVEAGLFIVPGLGSGMYAAACRAGWVPWEDACMLSVLVMPAAE